MPNQKVLQEAAEMRRRKRRSAERVYRRHQQEVSTLIRQLGGTPARPGQSEQATHDRALDLLSKMGETAAAELLEALADPTLDPIAADEVVSLLGATGDQRARPAR